MRRVLLVLFVLAGCASIKNYARWPYRGPMLLIRNTTHARRIILARDGVGRELVTSSVAPRGRYCFRWPFVHEAGYLLATGPDTVMSARFEPWTADGWRWDMENDPVADPKVCR